MSSHLPRFLYLLDLPGSSNLLLSSAYFLILSRFKLPLHTLVDYSIDTLLFRKFTIIIIRSMAQLRSIALLVVIVPKYDTVDTVDMLAFDLRSGLLLYTLREFKPFYYLFADFTYMLHELLSGFFVAGLSHGVYHLLFTYLYIITV